VYINTTAVDQDRIAQPGNYILIDTANDKLIWSAGSAAVADGQDTPTGTELDEAATIITTVAVEVDKLFLLDFSDTGVELKEIDLAGSTDTQYVLNFSFDNATASEPTLEAYDDNTHTSANLNVLGSGTPGDSMIKAVLTTSGSPGASWSGTPIAGAVAPNVLELNGGGGAFGSAAEVYVNLQVVIPASYPTPFTEAPVLTCRYTFV
ncbi:MAG TPA: hypothetical protein VLB82_10680, partial [Thermodesulfobacteriota bacterium]|nr:hypothetical protein [Thermodesulfobacteriota bacterium]